MKTTLLILTILTLAIPLTGCDNPQRTTDALRKEITSFQAAPTEEKKISIDANFAKLENQIDALEKQGKEEEASNMNSQRLNLLGDYQAAKMAKALNDAKNAVQGIGEAVKDGANSIGALFKKSGTGTATETETEN